MFFCFLLKEQAHEDAPFGLISERGGILNCENADFVFGVPETSVAVVGADQEERLGLTGVNFHVDDLDALEVFYEVGELYFISKSCPLQNSA